MHFTYKNSLLILAAILLVGGVFVFAEYRNSHTEKAVYTAPIVATSTDTLASELQSQDSDSDGLKDWEEVLLGTDPHKADTDGDKTSDGAEAAAGRNPLVKGPNDKEDTVKNGIAASATLTATDKAARDFFARYMQLNQAGLSGDADSQQQLIQDVIRNGVVLAKPKSYTSKDILVTPDSSKEAIRKYGNDLGGIFIKYNDPNARNEMVIAKDSVDNEDPSVLKELDPIISNYKNILTGLLKTKAPQTLSQNHLSMINSISILLFAAESVRKIDKDALSGIQGSAVWLGGANGLNASFNTLKSSFSANGIVYTSGESGSFFIPQ